MHIKFWAVNEEHAHSQTTHTSEHMKLPCLAKRERQSERESTMETNINAKYDGAINFTLPIMGASF